MDEVIEYSNIERAAIQHAQESEPDIRIVILYGWSYVPAMNKIFAKRVVNHPRLGNRTCENGDLIITSSVEWINAEIGCAKTRHTLYVLREPEKV